MSDILHPSASPVQPDTEPAEADRAWWASQNADWHDLDGVMPGSDEIDGDAHDGPSWRELDEQAAVDTYLRAHDVAADRDDTPGLAEFLRNERRRLDDAAVEEARAWGRSPTF